MKELGKIISIGQKEHSKKLFENKKRMTIDELSQRLQVSRKTIYGWTYRNLIPFDRIGPRLIRFDLEKIEHWIAEQQK